MFINSTHDFPVMSWFRRNEAKLSRKSERDIKNAKSLEEKIQVEVLLPKGHFFQAQRYLSELPNTLLNANMKYCFLTVKPQEAHEIVDEVNKKIEVDRKKFCEFNLERLIEGLSKREKETSYTLSEVLNHPIKYSQRGFKEAASDPFCADITVDNDVFSENSNCKNEKIKFSRKLRFYSCIMAAFGVSSVPHELIHAGVNKLTGGVNKEIVINKFYGGDIIHYFFPEIQSKWMIPLIGGYVMPENTSYASNMATSIAPYILLTPLGVYLLNKSKEKKNLALAYLGGGLVAGHAGGIIGDFFSIGKLTINEVSTLLNKNFQPDFLSTFAGFCLGTLILSYTYRLSKGAVNSIQKKTF